ncbi:MAG: serine/threonine protein kinase [Catenulispora sp.]|nr:serine/threonine protein kinase [Catenulispora sp.]
MRVGPYRLLTQLGSGAMGRVFLAVDDSGRQAAVKVVRSDLAEAPMFRKRFARELDVAQRVRGPHLAEIYAARPDGPLPWLATEYVPGPTLQEAVDHGGCFPSTRLRALASAVADALVSIHAAGVVHRDLKPSNILLGPNGPKVIDFGVARAADASLLTNTGQTLGTPAYMSPEQADGRPIESASDLFALGSLLVYAATGRLTFGDGAPLAILHRVVNNEPDLTGVAEDDPALLWLIQQCLAKDPDDRPTAARLIEILGEIPWQPLAGVAWRQPEVSFGLPASRDAADLLTVAADPRTVTADPPTVAARPMVAVGPQGRRGKRLAVISVATAAVLAIAGVAIVEGFGGDHPAAKASAGAGGPASGLDPGGGAFSGSAVGSGDAAGGGPNPNGGTPAASGGPAASPGGAAPSNSNSASPGPTGQPSSSQASHGGSTTSSPSKTTASKTTSKPTSPTKATTSAAAHKPPAPMASGEVKVDIPDWYLVAGVDVSWNTHPDATSYTVHFTESNGDDQTLSVPDPWYSYQVDKGVTTCVQVKAVNQYGETAYSPMKCVDPGPHQIH